MSYVFQTFRTLFAAIALVASAASGVAAHGKIVETIPAHGATLTEWPEVFEIGFNSEHWVTVFQLVKEGEEPIRLELDQGLEQTHAVRAHSPERLFEAGAYRLEWRALSPDGHVIKGEVQFTYAPE